MMGDDLVPGCRAKRAYPGLLSIHAFSVRDRSGRAFIGGRTVPLLGPGRYRSALPTAHCSPPTV